jgi:hypothetical protein
MTKVNAQKKAQAPWLATTGIRRIMKEILISEVIWLMTRGAGRWSWTIKTILKDRLKFYTFLSLKKTLLLQYISQEKGYD